MDFSLTDDQNALREAVERYVRREYDFQVRESRRRRGCDSDPRFWSDLAKLGVLALPFNEKHGGLNGSAADLFVVAQVFGRALLLEPWFACVILAGGVLRAADGPAAGQWLPRVADGSARLALAHEEVDSSWNLASVRTTAVRQAQGFLLHGTKVLVQHAGVADRILVTARTSGGADDPSGVSLFLVDPAAAGVRLRHYRTYDGHPAADVMLDAVWVDLGALVGEQDNALPAVQQAVDRGIAVLAAEAVGLMELLLDTTVEHLKTRRQFGKPLAAFQALQHGAVDMLMATEQVRSMALLATAAADNPDAAARARSMSAVKVLVGRAGRQAAQLAVQLHGAIGLTDECIVSHAFRRLTAIDAQFGDSQHHLALYTLPAFRPNAQATTGNRA